MAQEENSTHVTITREEYSALNRIRDVAIEWANDPTYEADNEFHRFMLTQIERTPTMQQAKRMWFERKQRDVFAAAALTGLIQRGAHDHDKRDGARYYELAFKIADGMMLTRAHADFRETETPTYPGGGEKPIIFVLSDKAREQDRTIYQIMSRIADRFPTARVTRGGFGTIDVFGAWKQEREVRDFFALLDPR